MYDFRYCVEYDCDTEYNCKGEGCDSICRCGRISNVHATEMNPRRMAECIVYEHLHKRDTRVKDALFLECIKRVCSRFRVRDFEINVARGYYGDEIGSISCEKGERLIADFLKLKTSTEWVEFYLTQEYGYVLESLRGLNWTIEKMDLDRILIPNNYRKLDEEASEGYLRELKMNKKDFLSCLVDSSSMLVDGYHRYQASVGASKKKIWAIHPV